MQRRQAAGGEEAKKARTTVKATAVPADVAALMSSLSLSSYGPKLVELGAGSVSDLENITLEMLEERVGMKPLEAARLLKTLPSAAHPPSAAAPPAAAQPPRPAAAPPVHVRALVVGIGDYASPDLKLQNPLKDARAVAESLRAAGAEVLLVLEPTRDEMMSALRQFTDPKRKPMPQHAATRDVAVRLLQRPPPKLDDKVVGLFFFAGHGLEADGENLLLPVDFAPPGEGLPDAKLKTVLKKSCVTMSDTLRDIGESGFLCRCGPHRSGIICNVCYSLVALRRAGRSPAQPGAAGLLPSLAAQRRHAQPGRQARPGARGRERAEPRGQHRRRGQLCGCGGQGGARRVEAETGEQPLHRGAFGAIHEAGAKFGPSAGARHGLRGEGHGRVSEARLLQGPLGRGCGESGALPAGLLTLCAFSAALGSSSHDDGGGWCVERTAQKTRRRTQREGGAAVGPFPRGPRITIMTIIRARRVV